VSQAAAPTALTTAHHALVPAGPTAVRPPAQPVLAAELSVCGTVRSALDTRCGL